MERGSYSTEKIEVSVGKGYEIRIGVIKELPEGFIITDEILAEKYKGLLGNREKYVIKSSEESKCLETYENILNVLKDKNVDRIVGLGGGIVGDLSGFVASTFKRGIGLVHVPTSLVGMIDSSIGGKTGINLGENKNYVGSFYQPEEILINPSFLKTLPEEEFGNGVAEIIKYAAVFGKPDLDELGKVEKENENMNKIIKDCCEVKVRVIEEDVRDKGYRHNLNFGHTIGHAVELLSGLKHGMAVSIGMVKELKLGEELGYVSHKKSENVRSIIEKNNLPTELPDIDIEKALKLMEGDKKGPLTFVFDKENYNVKVEKDKIREILRD